MQEEINVNVVKKNKIMEQKEMVQMIQDAATIILAQKELIDLLYGQVVDLSMMSKIELGDDVIAEIRRLKEIIGE
jgi:hypothetical protein